MGNHIPPIVSIDSMTLVWGLRQIGTDEQRYRAAWLLEQFTTRKTQVVLCDVVISEYLTAFEPDKHTEVLAELEKRFISCPFNKYCAPLAATLFQSGQQMRTKGEAGGRAILRADTMIIATAKTFGAARIYSHDDDFRKLANTIRPDFASDLPEPEKGLFGYNVETRDKKTEKKSTKKRGRA